ncbi:hypothetical protein JCM8547_005781 [Rhodosporidiobolus lusitaniae]
MSERTPLLATPSSGILPASQRPSANYDGKPPSPPAVVDPCDLIPLTRRERFSIMLGCYTAVALGALDMTITAALIGPIAASFHASHESSWLGTSFLLANITFTPLYGRLCDILGRRIANASAIFLFTLGTALCAVAPSMKFLILARFIAGAGGGGMNTTSTVIASDLFPLKQRGLLGSISTAIWAIGGATGGPLGGLLTDWMGWRSAFMLQVPLLLISLFSGLKQINYTAPGSDRGKESVRQKLARIDWIGCGSVFVSMGAFLVLLAMKNNENKPWSDQLVIAACVVAPIFLVLFLVNEALWAKEPILPYRILSRRTPMLVMLVTIFVAVCNFGVMYSLPLFFLAIEGKTAGEAGSHLLPTSIGNVVGGVVAGTIIHKTGKYRMASVVAGLLSVVGVVLISRLTSDSSNIAKWLDIFPMGIGFNHILNTSFVALMASVPHTDVPAVTGVMWLFRTTGQVLGVASTSAILQSTLAPELAKRITGKHAAKTIRAIRSDSSIITNLSPQLRQAAREAYALALRHVFWFCAGGAVLAWLSVCFIPDLNLDPSARPKPAPPASSSSSSTVIGGDEEERLPFAHDEAEDSMAERQLESERAGEEA